MDEVVRCESDQRSLHDGSTFCGVVGGGPLRRAGGRPHGDRHITHHARNRPDGDGDSPVSARGPQFEHALCNQVAIILGFCELLLDEIPQDHPLRGDLEEMHKAAAAAMVMLRSENPDS